MHHPSPRLQPQDLSPPATRVGTLVKLVFDCHLQHHGHHRDCLGILTKEDEAQVGRILTSSPLLFVLQ